MADKIKNFKTSREGKTALRNYARWVLKRKRSRWLSEQGKWSNDSVGQIDESILADRIEILFLKWDAYYDAVLVCVHDKTKEITWRHGDGNQYRVFHTWNDCEFWRIWEMVNALENHILFPKHF